MQWEDYPIVGSFNNQNITEIDGERSVNVFEYIDPDGKKPRSLISTSGLTNTTLEFAGSTNGFRGQFVFNGVSYSVIGADIWSWDASIPPAKINDGMPLTTFEGYVGIDANTFQIIFVDGDKGYIYDTNAATFTEITDTSFPANPVDVCYLDGFFTVINGDTNQFQLSMFNQGLVWGPDEQTFTADDTLGNNWLILTSTANYQTGVPFQVSTTGTLPNPLVVATTYYAIRVDATRIRVATSYDNAIIGTAITLTSNGTPTNTIRSLGQLQLGQVTSHPGTLVACRTLHRRIFFFSQNFTEVWENNGSGTNLPFRRNNALLMEVGTPSRWSVAVGFDKLFFLSQDSEGLSSVMMVDGTQSRPISSRAIDLQFSRYAANQQITVNDPSSILIKQNGLIFYRLNFTLANHTFAYDVSLSQGQDFMWHEEEVLNGDRHPAQTHMYFKGINYYGNYASPTMYIVDPDNSTNDGESIRRMRIGKPIVDATYKRRRIDRFQLDLLQGNVDNIPQNIAPVVFLSYSKDGGQTYGSKLVAPMGAIGERTFRTVWRKLGVTPRGQAFVPKIEFFNQVPFIILGAAWVFEVLPE